MKRHWVGKFFKVAVIGMGAIATVGFVVMLLWNALLPALFGSPALSYFQAVGLLILSRILVGGFRGWPGGGPGWHWKRRMLERWDQMTPEERERFRQGMRVRP